MLVERIIIGFFIPVMFVSIITSDATTNHRVAHASVTWSLTSGGSQSGEAHLVRFNCRLTVSRSAKSLALFKLKIENLTKWALNKRKI